MKIAIDCRSFRKKPAGVPNFLVSVINTLAFQKEDWTIYLLANQNFDREVNERLTSAANVVRVISPLKPFDGIATLWYLLKVPFLVKKLKTDLFFTPIPNLPLWLPKKVKTMITVHDMVYKRLPKTMSATNWWINFFLHDRSIQRADHLWAVSEYTKNEVELLFPQRKCKTIFVGASIDKKIFHSINLSPLEKQGLMNKFDIHGKFILFVGTQEPRKNLSFLVSLMPQLTFHGFSLLIVGAKGWGKTGATSEGSSDYRSDNIKFSGFISIEELVKLYSAATVYVSAALNEGFGLPQLEAMSCGCPVVAAHNSAMIEVVEGAGETVRGWETKDWIDMILKVAASREHYVSLGLQRAEGYRWDVVIRQLIRYIQ